MAKTEVAKRRLRGNTLSTGWSGVALLMAATCTRGIAPAEGAVDLSGGVTIGGEHDSNPTELSNDQTRISIANGQIAKQDDTARRLTANVAATTGVNGPISLQLNALYTYVNYSDYDTLNRTDYNVGGNLDWKPSRYFDASLQASQSRAPVPQNDIGGSQTVQQTFRQAQGTLRLRPTASWQVSLVPGWYDQQFPQPGPENFELRESNGLIQVDYLGAGKLVPGLFGKESRGEYSGVANATRYQQRSVGITLNYKVTGYSTFSLFAGQTRRTTRLLEPNSDPQALSAEGTISNFTGSLGYQRQLSVKTSFYVRAHRDFQPYAVGVNTTVGTGLDAGVTWKPTTKLSTTLETGAGWLKIYGLQSATHPPDERKDLERRIALKLEYLVTQHLSLRPYFTRRLHNSTVRTGVFDRTVAGLELSATFD